MRSFTVRGSESPGSKADVVRASREGAEPIDEIVESGRSPLDSIVRDGARRMLQAALESEVDAFLEEHAVLLDECGRRRVVRNGYLPTREIATGAGILEVSQPRVRDKASIVDERIVFSSKILPPYLRKSRSMEDLIPWLYLKGVSTGDFGEALESLIGPSAKGFSPNVIVPAQGAMGWGIQRVEPPRAHRSHPGEANPGKLGFSRGPIAAKKGRCRCKSPKSRF